MNPQLLIIDLFCGAGGTTTGFATAKPGTAKVIACVNHDPKAIESHWKNHPEVLHFEEDIRTLDLTELIECLEINKRSYPEAKVILWASLECTNFSKAKGGLPRDADSRTLADHLHRYVTALNPDYIQIENVVEFMSWGPLDKHGKPVSKKNGADWMKWRNEMCQHGFYDEWKEMNAADYGAYTSRNRLFGIFARPDQPITWPVPTHAKNPAKESLYRSLQKWLPVKEVLDFDDEGKSIFSRKKPLVDKTMYVIHRGLIKALKEGNNSFLFKYYGNGDNINSIDSPAGTLTTKDRYAKAAIILQQYKSGSVHSVEDPIGAVPTIPKCHLVSFIMNKSHGGHTTSSDAPCPVIVARQDKAPLYLIQSLMKESKIIDIKMRMLKVPELLKIQGFPEGYILEGTQGDQKKFIGNSVVPHVVKAWAEALADRLNDQKLKVA